MSKPHGQLRRSQVVTTFGPGSLLDLPNYSVLVGGLDHWTKGDEVHEDRLLEKLKTLLNVATLKLYLPPQETKDPNAPRTGITAWQFPEWFITEVKEQKANIRSRLLVSGKALTHGKYIDDEKKKLNVVPVRFVRACRKGHVADVDWRTYIHHGPSNCTRQLWMDERGTSGDLSEIWVRCDCGQERTMIEAVKLTNNALGNCDGSRPWLGPSTKESCGEPSRLLVRTASNAYFPQVMSVISLPLRNETVSAAVSQVWQFLEATESAADVAHERRKAAVKQVLEGLMDDEIFEEVRAKKGVILAEQKSIKDAEIETLLGSKEEIGSDKPDGDFFAKSLPKTVWNKPWMQTVEKVVLVHRLREVVAQVGFTRFEVAGTDTQGELDVGVVRAALARETTWLPAVENRGEGVFIAFKKAAIEEWLAKSAVASRGVQLREGFDGWMAHHVGLAGLRLPSKFNSRARLCGIVRLRNPAVYRIARRGRHAGRTCPNWQEHP
jgi:hypothetical protein